MPRSKSELIVDVGHPLLSLAVTGFLKIGAVAAAKVAAEEAYHVVKRGSLRHHNFEQSLKKMCKEGLYWGTVAAVYVGMEYGAGIICGTRDWKNAMIAGAVTGAIVSAGTKSNTDKIVMDAIAGAAIATAAGFLSYLT